MADRIPFGFDGTNPAAQQAALDFGATKVVDVDQSTRQAIRSITRRSIAEGIPPREAARLIRDVVGLTDRQANAVANFRAELVEQGLSQTAIREQVSKLSDRLKRQRALNIARTETIDALERGRRLGWEQAQEKGWLRGNEGQRWFTNPDPSNSDRPCPICAPMDGQTIGMDEQFITGAGDRIDGPTAHPQDRCGVRLVPAADLAEARGVEVVGTSA